MKERLLDEQIQEQEESPPRRNPLDYATRLTLDACQCRHLLKFLPNVLNLSCVHGDESTWTMANPVHALHLASHLESDGRTVFLPRAPHAEPALYGEEHCRTSAVTTEGISGSYCDLVATEQDSQNYTERTVTAMTEQYHAPSAPSAMQQLPKQTPLVQPTTTTSAATTGIPSRPSSAPPLGVPGVVVSRPNINPNVHSAPSVHVAAAPSSTQRVAAAASTPIATVPSSALIPPRATSQPVTVTGLTTERFHELRRAEELFLQQRRAFLSKRKTTSEASKKKKKSKQKETEQVTPLLPQALLTSLMGLRTVVKIIPEKWEMDARLARAQVEEWMERFRICRNDYWDNGGKRQCQQCSANCGESRPAHGDELMQCLECSFVGCAPYCLFENSKQHMSHHLLTTGHTFAVTCGERAEVFCFKCGDFVSHEVFEQEKERIDICRQLPWMGWKDHALQRSFDSMQFLKTPDHGIVWRGLVASYPSLAPKELVKAARSSMRRLAIFRGNLAGPSSLSWGAKAMELAVYQRQRAIENAWCIQAPVGMYNLGNTCFMSSILQCLIHCVPLQRYFLKDIGHHHKSCECIRSACVTQPAEASTATLRPTPTEGEKNNICLACEIDRLFLEYYGSAIGKDVIRAVNEESNPLDRYSDSLSSEGSRGDPLVTTNLLAAAWKSVGMDHLAGYEQRDAHEFLQAFLDCVGKQAGEYRKSIQSMQTEALPENVMETNHDERKQANDIAKQLFEGTLRSVLICGDCGCKRSLPEPFLNVSLPLSKHVHDDGGARGNKTSMCLQRCLEKFTEPESLLDPVDCPSCKKKTPTKKQHTFAKFPKVLCLHLKRFDAAKNRKISDFVSFPAYGLDMGRLLPHWCEAETSTTKPDQDAPIDTSPHILYDLFASANHTGNLHQGHYVANVKVQGQWYHCNDAHISKCDDDEVLQSEGAYVLFYMRR